MLPVAILTILVITLAAELTFDPTGAVKTVLREETSLLAVLSHHGHVY